MLLSIGMMVKNEEKYLDKCLQGILPILENINSELIIVDTGSTDNTVAIAKRYTDKVYHHEWTYNFGEMRNKVLSYVQGEWFFFLDGDEILDDATGVIEFFKSKKNEKYNAAFITIKNILEESNHDNYAFFHALRFFRRDKDFCFKGIVHEQPQAKGPATMIPGVITHYGYLNDDKELMEYKYQRNVELIKKVLEKEPHNIYHLFQLSLSYSMYGEKKKALEPILKAYELAKSKGLRQYMYVVGHLAAIYYLNQLYKEAENIAMEGIKLKDGYVDLYFYLAMSQTAQGKTEKAINSFHRYLQLVDKFNKNQGILDLSVIHTTLHHYEKAYLNLCILYKRIGDYKQALKYANLIEKKENIKLVIPHLIDIHIKENKFSLIKELCNKWLQNKDFLSIVFQSIEQHRLSMQSEEKKQLSKIFVDFNNLYGLLNRVRNHNSEEDIFGKEIFSRIKDGEFNNLENYYGDILYYLIKHRLPWLELFHTVKEDRIIGIMIYLLNNHEGFQNNLLLDLEQRLGAGEITDENTLRILAIVYGVLLRVGKLKENDYNKVFKKYLHIGVKFIQSCYHPEVIEKEKLTWARTNADAFLIYMAKYMAKAEQVKEDKASYVKYLRLALQQDITMKRGVEILLEEAQKNINPSHNQELETLKEKVMNSIEDSLNAGELDTAKMLIKEYEDIVGKDARICSAKAITLMIEQRLEEAKEVLLEGLKLEPDNSDLLYNMGYLYEQMGQIDKANYYYSKSK